VIRRVAVVLLAGLALLATPTLAEADFGFVPNSVKATAENKDGTIDAVAGSHPYAYTVSFELNTDSSGELEGGEARDIIVDLPPGFVGNPLAVPRCTRQQFEGVLAKCPIPTQIGVLRARLPGNGVGEVRLPLFNIEPPNGVAGALGASGVNLNVFQDASVRGGEEGYGLTVGAFDLPNAVISTKETIWGVPADPSHDTERSGNVLDNGGSASSEAPLQPFLTLPTSCGESQKLEVRADSKLLSGFFVGQPFESVDAAGHPASLVGCQSVPFAPTVTIAPTAQQADSPTGLDFGLNLPNRGLLDPTAIAETEPETTAVSLPEGLTVNPSAATGLSGCSRAQFERETAQSGPGQGCPEASKVGTLVARTPLLEEAIEGSVYLATPFDNEFDSLLALYLVARAPERGVLIKQAGMVQTDSETGQISTSFSGLPPLPYSSFKLHFREGPRAPLTTSSSCGRYSAATTLTPFSAPGAPVTSGSEFQIISGAGGGACPTPGSRPFVPSFSAGTVSPVAGNYSPFQFNLARDDGSQILSAIDTTLPLGLVGKLAGIPYCTDAQIATAAGRSNPGQGKLEQQSPSCPLASEVGTVTVGAGSGAPYYVTGHAYLAGPYKGAPLSLEIITPAVAGPFDLGSVAVRTALYVNESTAQIHAVSDPLPTILQGIPLDLRSIALDLARPQFVLNPTSCDATAVFGSATSTTGQVAALQSRFQVGGCKGLDFKPQLEISLKGATKRTGHPALKAVVTYPKGAGYANIARAQVGLPHSEFLDQGSIKTVCTQAELLTRTCPAASIYGKATAWTPLLDEPLTGPVYLGVGFGHKLPDLVAELGGQIRVLVHGKVDTDKQQGIRNTFEAVPDAPVSKFVLELKGGRKGLLENSTDICKGKHEAEARFTAHSGKVETYKTPVKANCGGKGKKGQKGKG
jgi:hypothetical protein